jgi:hypothetical protein
MAFSRFKFRNVDRALDIDHSDVLNFQGTNYRWSVNGFSVYGYDLNMDTKLDGICHLFITCSFGLVNDATGQIVIEAFNFYVHTAF